MRFKRAEKVEKAHEIAKWTSLRKKIEEREREVKRGVAE